MKLLKKIGIGLIVLVLLLALAVVFLPWKAWLEQELRAQLVQNGLDTLQFEMGDLGTEGITFNNLSLGDNSPFTLDSVTLGYAIGDLLSGKVKGLHTGALVFRQGDIEVRIAGLDVDIQQEAGDALVAGTWTLRDIRVTGLQVPLPLLQGSGSFSYKDRLLLAGGIKNEDASYKAEFSLDYPIKAPDKASATLSELRMPWNGGVVRIKPVTAAITGVRPITLPVVLERVSLGALMQQATGERANATGVISGQVPLVIARDGSFSLGQGSLRTLDAGVISLPPDVIPGDHPQVDLVREILKNFHYSDFSLTLSSDKPKQLSMLLSLKGNNPEVYDGRMVHLNVNLTGDLLDLLQQGMITIVDPKQLLKQDLDEAH